MNLTTKQAAKQLGVSEQRIRALIADGTIKTVKFGNAHQVKESELAKVNRQRGRPPIEKGTR